jgi:hypothetical protein
MMVAVAAVAMFLAYAYDWAGRRERCYELAS